MSEHWFEMFGENHEISQLFSCDCHINIRSANPKNGKVRMYLHNVVDSWVGDILSIKQLFLFHSVKHTVGDFSCPWRGAWLVHSIKHSTTGSVRCHCCGLMLRLWFFPFELPTCVTMDLWHEVNTFYLDTSCWFVQHSVHLNLVFCK